MKTNLHKPIFFNKNRVRRIYTGGKLFSEFFSDNSEDGFFPEEWVCSVTKALNEGSTDEKEGISVTEDGEYFDTLIENAHKEMLGDRKELGVLVKILDSSVRLPVQTHPDKEFSRKHFNSEHGKAESWIILATRDDACIYFGFKKQITAEQFKAALKGDSKELVPLLNRIPVKTGDVFFIPARAVHAIGAGCLILETQEPTDFTIQPENKCADYVLSDNEKYIGLDEDTAISCFDMDIAGDYAERISRKTPVKKDGREMMITNDDTPCFSVNRYTLENGSREILSGPAIYVITDGDGQIKGENYTRNIKKGDYFFVPFAANGKYNISSDTALTAVQCLPPNE